MVQATHLNSPEFPHLFDAMPLKLLPIEGKEQRAKSPPHFSFFRDDGVWLDASPSRSTLKWGQQEDFDLIRLSNGLTSDGYRSSSWFDMVTKPEGPRYDVHRQDWRLFKSNYVLIGPARIHEARLLSLKGLGLRGSYPWRSHHQLMHSSRDHAEFVAFPASRTNGHRRNCRTG